MLKLRWENNSKLIKTLNIFVIPRDFISHVMLEIFVIEEKVFEK